MLIESCSIPKYRDLSLPGDDLLLVLPGRLYAVFDGATDALGRQVKSMSSGRFAAMQAAQAMLAHAAAPDRAGRGPEFWLAAMNQAIAQGLADAGAAAMRVGCTAVLVEDAGGADLRFLIVGDSGLRINGDELLWQHKDIDLIFAAGRAVMFDFLQARGARGDALEMQTRQWISGGLDRVAAEILTPAQREAIIATALGACQARLAPESRARVADLLRDGIAHGQPAYANLGGHPLGYAVLDGGPTQGPELMHFSRPKASVSSIELFSDGYASVPRGSRLADWEAEFLRSEQQDVHKTGIYASTKGASSTQFSDDRTLLSVHFSAPV